MVTPRKLRPVHPNPPSRRSFRPPSWVQEFIDADDPAIDCVTESLTAARVMGADTTERDVFLWAVAEGRLLYRRRHGLPAYLQGPQRDPWSDVDMDGEGECA